MPMLISKGQKCIILMLDAFGMDYYRTSDMPNLRRMVMGGFFREGRAVFPTVTNANNISIACGAFPEAHGVTTNCYLDPVSGQPRFLEEASFLKSPTIFQRASQAGMLSALVTTKGKTAGILGGGAAVSIAAQDADAATVVAYGPPPDVYSAAVNEWVMSTGLAILNGRPDIDILYVHTTDYAMHMWAPDDSRSLEHLHRLDGLLGLMADAYPKATFLITADHGMNFKNHCLDLARILRAEGFPIKAAISPIADRLIKHHGGHGGAAYIYLEDTAATGEVLDFLQGIPGVDSALRAEEAALLYRSDADRIGDLVVGADMQTVFGTLDQEEEDLGPAYRNHGSRFEEAIPLITWNAPLGMADDLHYNLDLTRAVFCAA
jgi:phosphonoacetate hydrolase